LTTKVDASLLWIRRLLLAHEVGGDEALREVGLGFDPAFVEVHRQLTETGVAKLFACVSHEAISSAPQDRVVDRSREATHRIWSPKNRIFTEKLISQLEFFNFP
jgi:kynurenine formamidase